MPQKDIIIPGIKIKERSVFSLGELYKILYRWFELHEYSFQEQEYRDEDLGGGAKHIEIKWYAEKNIDDYFKAVIEINFLVLGLVDVEIEQEGVKIKSNKGEIELNTKAYLVKDYDRKWENSPVMRFLREVYDQKMIKRRIEGYEGILYEETYKMLDEVKAFLNLHRF
mgnify:FL=1